MCSNILCKYSYYCRPKVLLSHSTWHIYTSNMTNTPMNLSYHSNFLNRYRFYALINVGAKINLYFVPPTVSNVAKPAGLPQLISSFYCTGWETTADQCRVYISSGICDSYSLDTISCNPGQKFYSKLTLCN